MPFIFLCFLYCQAISIKKKSILFLFKKEDKKASHSLLVFFDIQLLFLFLLGLDFYRY